MLLTYNSTSHIQVGPHVMFLKQSVLILECDDTVVFVPWWADGGSRSGRGGPVQLELVASETRGLCLPLHPCLFSRHPRVPVGCQWISTAYKHVSRAQVA